MSGNLENTPEKKEPEKQEPAKKEPEKKESEKKEPVKKEPAKNEPKKKSGFLQTRKQKSSGKTNYKVWFFRIVVGLAVLAVLYSVLFVHPETKMTSTTLKNMLVESKDIVTSYNYYSGIGKYENYAKIQEWNIPFSGKRLLYTYQGKALLGINAEEIDVDVDDNAKTIRVSLPAIRILSNEVDPNSIEVYDESNNVFNPIKASDVFNQLAQEEKNQVENLKKRGMVTEAEEMAKKTITDLISASVLMDDEYKDYEIEVLTPHAGELIEETVLTENE